MNPQAIPFLAGLALLCHSATPQAPSTPPAWEKTITHTFTPTGAADRTTLAIYNINGFIRVEGYAGTEVQLEVHQVLTADDQATLDQGKQEFRLAFDQVGDTLMAYIAEPFDTRPQRNRWNQDNNRRIHYDFTLDFTVKVPYALNLDVATVNRGDVEVKDVTGALHVNNVNGAITLANAKGATDARTINGNVEAHYLTPPPAASSYYTLNGDIKVNYPKSLSADLKFKSFQGDFYTDFPKVQRLPAEVTRNQQKEGDGTVYRVSQDTAVRIGKGGQTLHFETFNGNVYVQQQTR
ncbi:hypothetical protein SAMN05421823_106212 [Catalinimonas alkaloidigena]|uniref:DUF4097 domain-containing protein n=1 Tax=Catalinimonas alkaloidigena TaxID=1075417 RepID=A0A1G9KN71_9BACT|nr:hypothetical protein [Catalinimonas alkaloidigena]SDL51152.1 hypothetical protein SAMN05421823_106212 [Catalinimonas alkaloidigena]